MYARAAPPGRVRLYGRASQLAYGFTVGRRSSQAARHGSLRRGLSLSPAEKLRVAKNCA